MISPVRRFLTIATAFVVAGACAPAPSTGAAPASRHNVITAEELQPVGDLDLYEAIRRLRPNFLRSHGGQGIQTGIPELQVYVGTVRLQEVDRLHEILARTVKEVTFLEPQQANARFGGNNSGGAIVVILQ
ncbi:MAG: hypothetical protein HOQ12_16885 [Gemmatimonadaceae bacterium]|nr:hypothetical protein [Gemmatimonadaceae bacterium]NUQ92812.1 hypothetical protein [Gemmatimonadaceae bacterium]NUR21213.1 hypothetical protein [Gemmatimonadaceae bacterium]